MMRHSVVLVAMLCVAGTALAQAPSPSGAHADWQAKQQQWEQKWQQERAKMQERRMDRLAVLLDMTPAQRQQVQTIFAAERTRMQQAMKQAMEARRAAHTETVTKLGQVLSPGQVKKLKLLMPERHRRFMMRRGPMGMHGMRGMHGPMDMRGMHGMHGPMDVHGPKGMWNHHPDQGPPPPPPPGQ
jgi:Spy/CpxP family protein refolding chaperone